MKFGSLFSGIGGFDLGLERAGMECAWQVEIDDYCRRVLAKHWPHVPCFEDVHYVGNHNLCTVDLIAGGFPCQPHSLAGQRRGADDDRNLWPEMRRIVAELRPRWVIAENVPGIRTTILDQVLFDLENQDYTCGTLDIPAVAFDAWHRRQRVFVVAHLGGQVAANSDKPGLAQRQRKPKDNGTQRQTPVGTSRWEPQPDVARVVHGVPDRVDRIKGLGNAVVPQVAEWLGRIVLQVDSQCFT